MVEKNEKIEQYFSFGIPAHVFQLQVGLQANVPQPYDDDEDGGDHNTTVDDIEAALTDLQVGSLDTET